MSQALTLKQPKPVYASSMIGTAPL
jgi:hypothetical protein